MIARIDLARAGVRALFGLCMAAFAVAGGAPSGMAGMGGMRHTPPSPIPKGAVPCDSLIRPGEVHFEHLWQLTNGGQNAEAYWSSDARNLIFQSTRDGYPCDQEYVLNFLSGAVTKVSTGKGRTTCGYFYDNDRRILFSSTHAYSDTCPPMPDYSKGYVWRVDEGYDIWTARPDGTDLKQLTNRVGYDAETTVSNDGKWLLFTSDRDGDLEIYKMHPDGTGVTRLTHTPGYDGGPWFSRDGKWICYRAHHPADSAGIAEEHALLAQHLVRPTSMDLWVMHADGTGAHRITSLPGASFAPYFTPDGKSIIFSSNWENPMGRHFDVYLVSREGGKPLPVTRDESFNAFPMFSPDGRWLVFESNRTLHPVSGQRGDTNIFMALWKP
jgi:Tol biopolymer transport system component